jgi:predicted lipid carrier protein YhbT
VSTIRVGTACSPAPGPRLERDAILGAVASPDEVQRSIRALMKKLSDADPEPDSIPNRTILCVIPDLNIAYWVELKKAKLRGLRKAEANEETDARITARSDDLIALIDGRLGIAYAFLTGKVKIDASASDLMMMRGLF